MEILLEMTRTVQKRLAGTVKDPKLGNELRFLPKHPSDEDTPIIEAMLVDALNTLCAAKKHGGTRVLDGYGSPEWFLQFFPCAQHTSRAAVPVSQAALQCLRA